MAAEIDNFFEHVMGIDDGAIRQAIIEQGCDSWRAMRRMTKDDTDRIARAISRPGGMVANPLAHLPNQQPTVPNRGLHFSAPEQLALKKTVRFLSYMHISQRTFDAADTTLIEVDAVWEYQVTLELYSNDIEPPGKWNPNTTMRATFESLDEYLNLKLGQGDIPLAYVVRIDADPPDEDDDLEIGQPTFQADLVRRARHNGPHWTTNNTRVWTVLRAMFFDTEVWPFLQPFQIRR